EASLRHSAGDIAALGRYAPGGGAVATAGAGAAAGHGGAVDQHMTFAALAAWFADEPRQRISRLLGRGRRTWLVRAAGAVDLARGDTGKPNARSLGTPDRAVTIPDAGWCALENLTGRNYGNGREEKKAHRPLYGSQPT